MPLALDSFPMHLFLRFPGARLGRLRHRPLERARPLGELGRTTSASSSRV